ncbi:MAG: 6-carboxytetrahydropterin synthase [Oscillospiraceae bacterium]|nr:6-carboxytetrahydropterin synthase [Oscillospiraceae bacterium]
MFQLKSEVQFDMAHYLHGYQGKCSNIHGHRYRLVAMFKAETLCDSGQTRGMVADFHEVKNVLRALAERYDHKLLVEDNEEGRRLQKELAVYDVVLVPYRPTAEEMSRAMFREIQSAGLPVSSVELYETPTNSCIYSE